MPGTVLALVTKMSAGAVSPQGVYSLVGKSEQMMTNISCHVSAVGCVAGRLNLVWNGISKAYGGSDSWGVSEEDSSIRGGEKGWHSGTGNGVWGVGRNTVHWKETTTKTLDEGLDWVRLSEVKSDIKWDSKSRQGLGSEDSKANSNRKQFKDFNRKMTIKFSLLK